jgi:hypothetical protein
MGNWLTRNQAQELLNATLKTNVCGWRDGAMLALLPSADSRNSSGARCLAKDSESNHATSDSTGISLFTFLAQSGEEYATLGKKFGKTRRPVSCGKKIPISELRTPFQHRETTNTFCVRHGRNRGRNWTCSRYRSDPYYET